MLFMSIRKIIQLFFNFFYLQGIDRLPTSSLEKASESTRRPRSVPLQVSPGVDWKSLIQVEKSSHPISSANIIWETEPLMPKSTTSAKEAVEMQKQKYEDESNILVVSEDPLNVSNSRNSYDALTNIDWKDGKKKTLAFQVKPSFSKNSQLSEQPSSSPIGYSSPPLQDTRFIKSLSSSSRFLAEKGGTGDEFGQPKTAPIIDDLESPLELRKISGADEEVLLNAVPLSKTTLKRDNFSRFTTKNNTNELRVEKELILFEGFSHICGDGKHEIESDRNIIENFDPLYEVKQRKTDDTERALKAGSPHSDTEHVGIPKDEKDPALLLDTRLGFMSSELQTASSLSSQPIEADSRIATLNVSTSRKAAENLPVRPLTIGDSLTIASTTTYRPISPFQPNIDAVASAPMVLPDTNITTMAYSEGPLDADEEIGDMSARERLQPLGRDGLEVKQGPPWGITMPLFQPDSRNSSLSSNNSSTSGMQFTKLQMSLNEQTKVETEPLKSRSSTPSETGLSRKASVRSLEPKEPMAVKLMPDGGDVRTPIAKFRQHDVVDVDSPVSKILGPTFKATQHMLEELQRRPLGAYVEDLEQYTTNTENERNIRQRHAYTDKKLLLTNSDDGPGTEAHHASNIMEGRKHSQTRDDNNSNELVNKTPGNSYYEPSTIQFEPNVLPVTSDSSKSEEKVNEVNQVEPDEMPVTHTNLVEASSVGEDLQRVASNTTIEKSTELMSSHAMLKGFPINQHTADLKHFTPDIPGVVNNTTSFISERGTFQRDVDKVIGDKTTGLKTTGVAQEFSRSQQATVSSVPHIRTTTPKVVDNNGVQQVQDNRPSSSGKSFSASSRSSFSEGLLTRSTLSSSPTIMANSLSQACHPVIEAVHSQKNYSPKILQTSTMSDSTLGNSIALPGDLVQTHVKDNKEGKYILEPFRSFIFFSCSSLCCDYRLISCRLIYYQLCCLLYVYRRLSCFY